MSKLQLNPEISINSLAQKRVDNLYRQCHDLHLLCTRTEDGTLLIDAGIKATGGLEAGRQIAEICLGGLGQVSIRHDSTLKDWQTTLHVHTSHPVMACLASQYAGWSLAHGEGKTAFHALGSGPGRARACKEPLFEELAYKDTADSCVLVLEVDTLPPSPVIDYIAESCGIQHDKLSIIVAPIQSIAGSLQVVARVLEVAMHKSHELGFPLETIVNGIGSVPLVPPAPDFVGGMGRTNDAILFAGQVQLFVNGDESAAYDLAQNLPSNTSKDYGKPFAQVFKDHACDFFKIDPMLFSPAKVAVTHLPSGKIFHAGEINESLLKQSCEQT